MTTPPLLAPVARAAIIALLVTACQPVLKEKGNILEPDKVATLQSGVTTRAQVLKALGSPTLVNSFQKERWIYIQERLFDGKRVVNRLEIEFDAQGRVREVQRNFDDQLLDPQTAAVTEEDPSSWRRIWNAWTRDDKRVAVKAREGEPSSWEGIINPPSWWQRVFNREQYAASQPAPEVTYAPEESGWWQGMWERDPSQPLAPESGPLTDPAANVEPARPEGGGKQIWQIQ